MAVLKPGQGQDDPVQVQAKDDRSATIIMELVAFGLIVLFLTLPAIIGAGIAYLIHWQKWKGWIFAVIGAIGSVMLVQFGFGSDYYQGISLGVSLLTSNNESTSFGEVFLLLLPLSLSLGLVLGTLLHWLVKNRPELVGLPVKVVDNTVINLEVNQRKLKNLPDIEDGVILGLDADNQPITLLDKEANMHSYISGATGAGKTNTIRIILESAIRRGKPCIIIDGKGDLGFMEEIRELAEFYNRDFQGFSYTGKTKYNPLRRGNYTELKDKLIAIEEWTEPYYKRAAERYLQLVFKILQLAGRTIDLQTVQDMLTQKNLMEVLKSKDMKHVNKDQINVMKEYVNTLDSNHKNALDGLKDRLALLTESDVGPLFHETGDGDGDVIDLFEAIKQKKVIHMALSGLSYSSFTPALGAMIVEDLKSVAAAVGEHGWIDHIYVVLDEFNLFAGENVVNMINKSRSVGFCCLMATQELADLQAGGGEELIGQVIGNTNVKIVHRQDVPSSAEYMAEVVGTVKVADKTTTTTATLFGALSSGVGSVRTIEEYRIHPNTLKTLRQGQAVVIKKTPNNVAAPTQIRSSYEWDKKMKKKKAN
ncbi:type IV secretory system conjugative DNA transfer family protein [Risungbinella massiliensis]|uniref:type IV secretory system conjugative DNA transfer family protein n=1 Tax=Risungbinella massiliensis TaxID=1329796 RepID=UPI0005CB9476|nr:helicase HerA-like domain-containing protein [Risungbinella massiliensis]